MTEVSEAPPRPAALPYLCVANARAPSPGTPTPSAGRSWRSNRYGRRANWHAEIEIAGEYCTWPTNIQTRLKAPEPQAVSVSLMLHVLDTDAALQRTREHGATVVREIEENYGTRNATIIDPFGHRWMLSDPSGRRSGTATSDTSRCEFPTPSAAAFYGHVLGWTYDPATHRVINTDLPTESTPARYPNPVLLLRRDQSGSRPPGDRRSSGVAGETRQTEHGSILDATDSQGRRSRSLSPLRTGNVCAQRIRAW
nr:VOC family protein [Mycobacterium riyadhense]